MAEPQTSSRARLDLLVLGVIALLVRLPALFATRHLTFDDGVFASSALAMRDGDLPFRDVFSSQGPLFLPLVWVGDLVGGRTLAAPRLLAVVSGVGCVLALYWVARKITDRVGALLAAGLAATAGSLVWVTGPLAADGPALLFAIVAFGLALDYRARPTAGRAVLIGVAVGAALSTKAIEVHLALPVGLVLLTPFLHTVRRRPIDWSTLLGPLVAVVAAVSVFVVAGAPFGLAAVWDQAFTYRADAAVDRDPLANAGKLIATLWDRDLAVLVFAVACLVAWFTGHRRDLGADDRPPASLLLWLWLGGAVLWLVVVVSPLSRPHLSGLIPPAVLLIGLYRPPVRATQITAALLVPVLVLQLDGVLWPRGYSGTEAEIVAVLEELPPDAWVLSDEPGLVWRTGRRTTADLVDPSMYRVEQDRITEDSLAAQAADPRVCAVVIRSGHRFGAFPGLPERLRDEGYERILDHGGPRAVYVRDQCEGANSGR